MAPQHQRRILILDTSSLVDDPSCIEGFPHDIAVITPWVIDELDRLKRNYGERGEHALQALRNIHEYHITEQGITIKNGGILKAETVIHLPQGIEPDVASKNIFLAKKLMEKYPGMAVIIISKDLDRRIKANMFGIASEDYKGNGITHDPYVIFPGCSEIYLHNSHIMNEISRNSWIDIETVNHATSFDTRFLTPNQCVRFLFEEKEVLGLYKKELKGVRHVPKPKKEENGKMGIMPRNCEQAFAYSLLMDPEIKLVALIGTAGSGKTLMSLLGAYHQLKNEFDRNDHSAKLKRGTYDQIMVFRPNIELGQPLGFLPGDINEKFEPWMYPIFDNLHLILQGDTIVTKTDKCLDPVFDMIDTRRLDIAPINFIRGRSFHKKIIIIDEAQNLTRNEVRSLVTRAGAGSKVVLTGDISQIDHPYVDQNSNGLSHVVSKFMGQEIFGYTIMKRGEERSLLAKLGSELL